MQKSLGCANHPCPPWARICPGSLVQSKLGEWALAPLGVGPELGLGAGALPGQPQCGKGLDGAPQKCGGGALVLVGGDKDQDSGFRVAQWVGDG